VQNNRHDKHVTYCERRLSSTPYYKKKNKQDNKHGATLNGARNGVIENECEQMMGTRERRQTHDFDSLLIQ
jgi:hypothetical protein